MMQFGGVCFETQRSIYSNSQGLKEEVPKGISVICWAYCSAASFSITQMCFVYSPIGLERKGLLKSNRQGYTKKAWKNT